MRGREEKEVGIRVYNLDSYDELRCTQQECQARKRPADPYSVWHGACHQA
jgi:hypothetical protein